jgi:3-oxoacyl-[acyl-carrier protein] reductase
MTKALALEVADSKIRVNGLCPVAGETPMLKEFLGDSDQEENHKKIYINGSFRKVSYAI